jgi:transmembrane sensor
MDLKNEENFKSLINSYLSKQASKEDYNRLKTWIEHSKDNKKHFIELSRTWLLTSQVSSRGKFNKAKYDEWKKLSEILTAKAINTSVIPISPLQKVIRIAAVLLLLVSVGATIAWRITSQRLHNLISMETVHRINVPLGGKSEVILPDGSMVKLNAGSNLTYSGHFGLHERIVMLEGEGYFEVETNPELPFVVEASNLKIKAFGTKFNVKAYPEEEEITTTLIEGVVKIEGVNIDLTLEPSQKVTYIKARYRQVIPEEGKIEAEEEAGAVGKKVEVIEPPRLLLAKNINTREITSWKDGFYIFSNEKLISLAVILERKYDVSIKIESEELMNHRFTGTFHHETLEQILSIINMSAPISYKIDNGVVTIQLDKRRRHIFEELSMN